MTKHFKQPAGKATRLTRHRKKVEAGGSRRIEVTVPSRDAPLVKAVAGTLRAGGDAAENIRELLQPLVSVPKARTGKELVAFLRASPLVEMELDTARDRSTGRAADLG